MKTPLEIVIERLEAMPFDESGLKSSLRLLSKDECCTVLKTKKMREGFLPTRLYMECIYIMLWPLEAKNYLNLINEITTDEDYKQKLLVTAISIQLNSKNGDIQETGKKVLQYTSDAPPKLRLQVYEDTHQLLVGVMKLEDYEKKANAIQSDSNKSMRTLGKTMMILGVLLAASALVTVTALFCVGSIPAVASIGLGLVIGAGMLATAEGMGLSNKARDFPCKQEMGASMKNLLGFFKKPSEGSDINEKSLSVSQVII